MSSPDSLLRATLNRLAARLGHGLADAAAGLAVLAKDAPERFTKEWHLFQHEVMAQPERLEQTQHVGAAACLLAAAVLRGRRSSSEQLGLRRLFDGFVVGLDGACPSHRGVAVRRGAVSYNKD